MAHKESLDALERKMPKIFDVENKLQIDSKMVPEVKDWVTGEDYRLTEVIMTQLASRELKDGTIESEFEIKSIKANGIHKRKK